MKCKAKYTILCRGCSEDSSWHSIRKKLFFDNKHVLQSFSYEYRRECYMKIVAHAIYTSRFFLTFSAEK